MNENVDFGLGRVKSKPDQRSAAFPLAAVLPAEPSKRVSRYHYSNGIWLDQGSTSECVAYSFAHYMEDGPRPMKEPLFNVHEFYKECQRNDWWEGEDYDGTSTLACAKVAKSRGFIKEYRWTNKVQEMAECVLEVGAVLAGTDWFSSMFFPDTTGRIKITGFLEGGHQYKVDGYSRKTRLFRIKNSWGRQWGKNGFAYIHENDMQTLIDRYGEIMLAIKK